MGQIYNGTLVIQTKDSTSPTGNYVLSVLSDQAEEKDIINNKQGYNGTGNMITGTNKKGYAGQVFSETEMDSYLTEENVGRILQYLGQAEGSEGGTPASVPFGSSGDGVGTVADATGVYLNPDLNATAIKTALANSNSADAAVAYLPNADSETMFMLYIKNDNDVLIICKMDEASDTYVPFYAEQAGTYKNTAFAGGFENIPTDGNVAGFIPLAFYTPSEEIATIFDLFVSKTPFSGGGSAYTTGAIYQVVDDGAAIVFKEIRI